MSAELSYITALMFGAVLAMVLLGVPMAFALGGVGVFIGLWLWGPSSLAIVATQVLSKTNNFTMLSIPLFVFMACELERSGVTDNLYSAMHKWMGPLRGGLAIGTVCICTLLAAMTGVSATATVTMGLIAVPAMLERGYDRDIVLGSICAGGALGVLIPPSILFVVMGDLTQVSVGSLFIGGILPGLLLSGLYIGYIAIRSFLQPKMGPPLPLNERSSMADKLKSLRSVILPILLVLAVLGTIYMGVASVTEAASIGAVGSIISAAINRRLTWRGIVDACRLTLRTTAMIMWIVYGAAAFNSVYTALGAQVFIRGIITPLAESPWLVIIATQVILFILGCFLEPVGIILITGTVFFDIIRTLGLSPIWFGVMVVINLQMGYLTPPFGASAFYLKSVVPKNITLGDIFHSVFPFVGLQALGLILVAVFPGIATWLPNLMMK